MSTEILCHTDKKDSRVYFRLIPHLVEKICETIASAVAVKQFAYM